MVDALLVVLTLSAFALCIVGFGVRWHSVSQDLAYIGQVSDRFLAEEKAELPPEIQRLT